MNTQKYRTNYQKGGATRKVFKIGMDKQNSPPIITVNNVDSSATLNDGVSFDDFYKSYVDKSQDSKSMYIAVNISDDNKIENFDIKDINSNDNTAVGVMVQTPGTQSSAANSSANAVNANPLADTTNAENSQMNATISVEQKGNATNSVEQQGNATNTGRKNGGKRNLTKRRKRRHSRK